MEENQKKIDLEMEENQKKVDLEVEENQKKIDLEVEENQKKIDFEVEENQKKIDSEVEEVQKKIDDSEVKGNKEKIQESKSESKLEIEEKIETEAEDKFNCTYIVNRGGCKSTAEVSKVSVGVVQHIDFKGVKRKESVKPSVEANPVCSLACWVRMRCEKMCGSMRCNNVW